MAGLSVSDVVSVAVNMSPLAVPLRNFGTLLLAGNSDVIDVSERIRAYATLDEVLNDFGTTAPEAMAADLFFSQSPRPAILYVGRVAITPTSAVLHGGILTPGQQQTLLTQLNAITNGSFAITVDGTPRTVSRSSAMLQGGSFDAAAQASLITTLKAVTNGGFNITVDGTARVVSGVDFSTIVTLADAATAIQAAMGAWGTAEWNTGVAAFRLHSSSTGTASTITFAASPASGTDVSVTLKLTQLSGALSPSAGTDGLNFSAATNLNGVATIINNALVGARCWFDGTRFHIESLSVGPVSTLTYASNAGTGTDISSLLRLQTGQASVPVNGIAAETPLAGAANLRAHPEWYGLQFAVTPPIADADLIQVAEFIEGCDPISIFGYTTQNTTVLDSTVTTDIASQMKAFNYMRTFGQFSSSSPYAAASAFARAFTVDFEANNTTITLKFKVEPGVQGELLTEQQARTLKGKNCNVFVFYSNDTAIIQEGVMANGYFFDEVHGLDWQANRVQTDVFNVLYQAPTKIPQTNAGLHVLVTTVEASLNQGVVNGLIAPGQWNAPGFGQISTGQMLTKGFYVFSPLLESQPQAIREQRIAPTIQCAIKLAGAIHFANIILNVNR